MWQCQNLLILSHLSESVDVPAWCGWDGDCWYMLLHLDRRTTKTASALQTCLCKPGIRSFHSSELPNKAVFQLAASKLHHREKLVSPLPNISLTNQPQCPSSSPCVLHASLAPASLSLQLGLHSAEELFALYFCCLPVYAVWIFKRSSNHHIKQLRVPIDPRFKQLQRVI